MGNRHVVVQALISAAERFSKITSEPIGTDVNKNQELVKTWVSVSKAVRMVHRLLTETHLRPELTGNWLGLPFTTEEMAALEILYCAISLRLGCLAQWCDGVTQMQQSNIVGLVQSISALERYVNREHDKNPAKTNRDFSADIGKYILALLELAGIPPLAKREPPD